MLSVPAFGQPAQSPAALARADSGRPAYTKADVRFMQGMIHHHAQAIMMARWAPTHGASESLKRLTQRIDVAQSDEIAFMQRWLHERKLDVPDAAHGIAGHVMPGDSLMPGMLTAQQVAQLDAARGVEFDRLFLTFMMQHHRGALDMVQTLFGSPGAAYDTMVFRFASDVEADQSTEIERMQKMLDALPAPR